MCGVLLLISGGLEGRQSVTIGDSQLRLTLGLDKSGLREELFEVAGKAISGVTATPWTLETDAGAITPASAVSEPGADSAASRGASFKGSLDALDWRLDYRVIGPGMISKTLTLTPKKDLLLKQVSLWQGRSEVAPVVANTSLQDITAFYRQKDRGMFVSLDFAYSRIATTGRETGVTYPPYDDLKAGQAYTCHSLTVGATVLTGRMRYGFDEGEVDAMDSYIQRRFAPRFNRPMFVSASIYNRYTMPRGDVIFYTMRDHPSFSFNIDLLKREIELMPKLGIEYYQVFPGPFDSVPGDPDPKAVREMVEFARKHGVRIGDYSGTSSIFCSHYNEYGITLDNHPEWGVRNADVCFGNPKFIKFYKDIVVDNDKRYGFEIHTLDFLNIHECNATDHNHPVGRDSIYAQVRGLVEILEGINAVSSEMMT